MKYTDSEHKLTRLAGKLIQEFNLIENGDNIMVAVSGGKDSLALLRILQLLQKRAPVKFKITAVHLFQGTPGFEPEKVSEIVKNMGIELTVIDKPTYEIVKAKTKDKQLPCFMCSRLRRGILYNFAHENGFNKIALGHHRDDMLETFLLNLFRTGQLKTIPPILISDDKRNTVIRPLLYCSDSDIVKLIEEMGITPVPCGPCAQNPEAERLKMKKLLEELERNNPHVRDVMAGAMKNIRPGYLLDKDFFKLAGADSGVSSDES